MNRQQLSEALKDYHWMVNEIARQRKLLQDAGTKLVAQTGTESAMPKAQGDPSDPVSMEVIRRDKKYKWIAKLEDKVTFIQERTHVADNEREIVILECMMDGMSMTAISNHLGLSRRHVHNIRDTVIDKMVSTSRISHISHFAHIAHKVTSEKATV
ncbi:LuxR C-terminal-related transcriptional regulator [Paraliobacillus ryukyuensis]|uniref:LuxR C-terminal-related transcriptional regulator n=1 Tax=Paraliobacillus ryukyuensis TaxID=200904 RepID=UPI0009A7E516|nr:LuxR C-terminal-related transcriptional regulator [Paraliobacillus ryukyuensis]